MRPQQQHPPNYPPQTHARCYRRREPQCCQKHPVRSHPGDQKRIPSMPGVSLVTDEKGPLVAAVILRHEHPDPTDPIAGLVGILDHPFFPENGQEQRASTVHDRNVR